MHTEFAWLDALDLSQIDITPTLFVPYGVLVEDLKRLVGAAADDGQRRNYLRAIPHARWMEQHPWEVELA